MTTVYIADDHQVVRHGLRGLLEVEGFHVVGESGDGLETAEAVEHLHPDLLVLDLMMPGLHGLEVTRRVTRRSPSTAVIVLSMHSGDAYVLEALRAGARAYVLKGAPSDEVVRAAREVLAGRRYLSPPLTQLAIESYLQKTAASAMHPYESLTAREREVLQLAAGGMTSVQIAERLTITSRTAETHRTNLMRKLGLHNQADLVRFALRHGLITGSDT